MTLMVAGQIAVEGIFYSAVGFVLAVSFFWPWWRSQLGWSITAKSLALAIAVLPAMLTYWAGPNIYKDAPWLQWVAISALWLIPPILAWRAVVIWQAQRKARDVLLPARLTLNVQR